MIALFQFLFYNIVYVFMFIVCFTHEYIIMFDSCLILNSQQTINK